MRVSIIGPVMPFRSGIARHTSALVRELSRRSEVKMQVLSFARQFPAFLYPGESDRDCQANPPAIDGLDYCIDSMNPMNWRASLRRVLDYRPDIAVIPAWTFFLAPCLGTLARGLRRQGIPVTMIVHNAEDHEAASWKNKLMRFQLRQATRFITHNTAIADDLRQASASTPTIICPHPIYDDYPPAQGRLPREAALELLFFGLVRPYKGLDICLRALALADLPDVRLAVVGEFWKGSEETERLVRELGLGNKVELVPRYVSDEEAAEYFARCDAVVAPYRSATGSGVVALAQWYRRPVIVSNVPGLAAAVDEGVTGWHHPVGDAAALADVLRAKVSRQTAAAMRPAMDRVCAELSWERFADGVIGDVASLESTE